MCSLSFNINGSVITDIPNIICYRSEYVKGIINDLGANTIIDIPDKYATVIHNYIDHLKNSINNGYESIKDIDNVKLCLLLATYFDDSVYFKYVVKQILDTWSYMFTMVYTELTYDIEWLVLLHCPYDFLPRSFITNNIFIRAWEKNNPHDTVINVNGNEVYYYNKVGVDYDQNKTFATYHTVNNKQIGRKFVTRYYPSGELKEQAEYVDNELQGLVREWYISNGQLESETQYDNGERHGLHTVWYYNGNIKSKSTYVHDEQHGIQITYYYNEQCIISSEIHYERDERSGLAIWWFNNEQHSIQSTGSYVDSKRHGLWKWWYDNPNHTLKFTREYNNGRIIGQQVNYDENGNITNV